MPSSSLSCMCWQHRSDPGARRSMLSAMVIVRCCCFEAAFPRIGRPQLAPSAHRRRHHCLLHLDASITITQDVCVRAAPRHRTAVNCLAITRSSSSSAAAACLPPSNCESKSKRASECSRGTCNTFLVFLVVAMRSGMARSLQRVYLGAVVPCCCRSSASLHAFAFKQRARVLNNE